MELEQAIQFALEVLDENVVIKSFQQQVISSYTNKEDCFCIAPTGAGKSLIFKVAPLVLQSMSTGIRACKDNLETNILIIQPLKGLMKEQCTKLTNKGMKAIYFGDEADKSKAAKDLALGQYNYIIASPESASSKLFCDSLPSCNIKCIFVDESHCIKTLGHTDAKKKDAFRTAYGDLGMLRAQLPGVPVVALTATATASIRATVLEDLCMTDCAFVNEDANRTNIRYSVVRGSDFSTDFQWLMSDLEQHGAQCERVLVFCQDKTQCYTLFELFTDELGDKGYANPTDAKDDTNRLFGMYHRGTREEQKKTAEASFADPDGHMRVLFCTSSFGMGMDVKACHLVIHLGPPKMLDAYLQESGRVGRDGKPSHSVVLLYRHCLSGPGFEQEMIQYVKNRAGCRRIFLLKAIENPVTCSLDIKHWCCDFCSRECHCLCTCEKASSGCMCPVKCVDAQMYQSKVEQTVTNEKLDVHQWVNRKHIYAVSDDKRELFKLKLEDLNEHLLSPAEKDQTLVGLDITTGFTSYLIDDLVKHVEYISSESMLLETFPFFKHVHASLVFTCVSEVFSDEDRVTNKDNTEDSYIAVVSDDEDFNLDTDSEEDYVTRPLLDRDCSTSTDSETDI